MVGGQHCCQSGGSTGRHCIGDGLEPNKHLGTYLAVLAKIESHVGFPLMWHFPMWVDVANFILDAAAIWEFR